MRDQTIDIAKGFGIICVVWGHQEYVCPFRDEIYLFHMPLFFMLSGYLFKDAGLTLLNVIKKRIQSYLIPYIVFFIIILGAFILLYESIGYGDKIYLSPGILIHPYGVLAPLWFLLSLFEVHIAYYCLSKYVKKEWLIFAICLICLVVSHLAFRYQIKIPFYIGASLAMLIFYHTGYLMSKYRILSTLKYRLTMFTCSLIFYIGGILSNAKIDIMKNLIEGNLFWAVTAAFGGAYIIIYISYLLKEYNKIPYINDVLNYLGKNTLTIFSMHLLCIEAARCLFKFPRINEASTFDGIYTVVWGIVGSLIIGYPIKKYILPHIKLFK